MPPDERSIPIHFTDGTPPKVKENRKNNLSCQIAKKMSFQKLGVPLDRNKPSFDNGRKKGKKSAKTKSKMFNFKKQGSEESSFGIISSITLPARAYEKLTSIGSLYSKVKDMRVGKKSNNQQNTESLVMTLCTPLLISFVGCPFDPKNNAVLEGFNITKIHKGPDIDVNDPVHKPDSVSSGCSDPVSNVSKQVNLDFHGVNVLRPSKLVRVLRVPEVNIRGQIQFSAK